MKATYSTGGGRFKWIVVRDFAFLGVAASLMACIGGSHEQLALTLFVTVIAASSWLLVFGTARLHLVLRQGTLTLYNLPRQQSISTANIGCVYLDRRLRVYLWLNSGGPIRVECIHPLANPRLGLYRASFQAIVKEAEDLAVALAVPLRRED